jgi:hypothetical protein
MAIEERKVVQRIDLPFDMADTAEHLHRPLERCMRLLRFLPSRTLQQRKGNSFAPAGSPGKHQRLLRSFERCYDITMHITLGGKHCKQFFSAGAKHLPCGIRHRHQQAPVGSACKLQQESAGPVRVEILVFVDGKIRYQE